MQRRRTNRGVVNCGVSTLSTGLPHGFSFACSSKGGLGGHCCCTQRQSSLGCHSGSAIQPCFTPARCEPPKKRQLPGRSSWAARLAPRFQPCKQPRRVQRGEPCQNPANRWLSLKVPACALFGVMGDAGSAAISSRQCLSVTCVFLAWPCLILTSWVLDPGHKLDHAPLLSLRLLL